MGAVLVLMVEVGRMGRLEQGRAGMLLNERDALEFSGWTGCL